MTSRSTLSNFQYTLCWNLSISHTHTRFSKHEICEWERERERERESVHVMFKTVERVPKDEYHEVQPPCLGHQPLYASSSTGPAVSASQANNQCYLYSWGRLNGNASPLPYLKFWALPILIFLHLYKECSWDIILLRNSSCEIVNNTASKLLTTALSLSLSRTRTHTHTYTQRRKERKKKMNLQQCFCRHTMDGVPATASANDCSKYGFFVHLPTDKRGWFMDFMDLH